MDLRISMLTRATIFFFDRLRDGVIPPVLIRGGRESGGWMGRRLWGARTTEHVDMRRPGRVKPWEGRHHRGSHRGRDGTRRGGLGNFVWPFFRHGNSPAVDKRCHSSSKTTAATTIDASSRRRIYPLTFYPLTSAVVNLFFLFSAETGFRFERGQLATGRAQTFRVEEG